MFFVLRQQLVLNHQLFELVLITWSLLGVTGRILYGITTIKLRHLRGNYSYIFTSQTFTKISIFLLLPKFSLASQSLILALPSDTLTHCEQLVLFILSEIFCSVLSLFLLLCANEFLELTEKLLTSTILFGWTVCFFKKEKMS